MYIIYNNIYLCWYIWRNFCKGLCFYFLIKKWPWILHFLENNFSFCSKNRFLGAMVEVLPIKWLVVILTEVIRAWLSTAEVEVVKQLHLQHMSFYLWMWNIPLCFVCLFVYILGPQPALFENVAEAFECRLLLEKVDLLQADHEALLITLWFLTTNPMWLVFHSLLHTYAPWWDQSLQPKKWNKPRLP